MTLVILAGHQQQSLRGELLFIIVTATPDNEQSVAVIDFGGDKTCTSGTFTIQFPTADASDAILRLA